MMKLLGLMSKKTTDLTVDDLNLVAKTLKIDTLNITDELKNVAVGLLAGRDINDVASLVKDPASIQMVAELFQGKRRLQHVDAEGCELEGNNAFVHQCRHCKQFEIIEL